MRRLYIAISLKIRNHLIALTPRLVNFATRAFFDSEKIIVHPFQLTYGYLETMRSVLNWLN